MNAKELAWIKAKIKEYEALFGKDLIIDFVAMKGLERCKEPKYLRDDKGNIMLTKNVIKKRALKVRHVPFVETVEAILDKRGVKLETIRKCNIRKSTHAKERDALIEIANTAMSSFWNLKEVASYINRDRSAIYYYATDY